MISATHFDHRAAIWRFFESTSATLRVKERSWAQVPQSDRVPMAVQVRRETWGEVRGGEKVGGEYQAFAHASVDVMEGDVIDVHEGPEAPVKLEVDSVYRPLNRHTQLVLIPWDGSLA